MSVVLDRQAVMDILANFEVGRRLPIEQAQTEAYREDIASAVMALTERVGVVHVTHADAEESAQLQNLGWDAAVEQFAEILALAKEDLAPEASAGDLMGWIEDAVESMVADTRAATVRVLEQVRDASHTAEQQGAVDRCIAALTGGAR